MTLFFQQVTDLHAVVCNYAAQPGSKELTSEVSYDSLSQWLHYILFW